MMGREPDPLTADLRREEFQADLDTLASDAFHERVDEYQDRAERGLEDWYCELNGEQLLDYVRELELAFINGDDDREGQLCDARRSWIKLVAEEKAET